jgi:hypothetical protein
MSKLKFPGFPEIISWGHGTNTQSIYASAPEPNYHFIIQKKLGISLQQVVE